MIGKKTHNKPRAPSMDNAVKREGARARKKSKRKKKVIEMKKPRQLFVGVAIGWLVDAGFSSRLFFFFFR